MHKQNLTAKIIVKRILVAKGHEQSMNRQIQSVSACLAMEYSQIAIIIVPHANMHACMCT